MNNIQELRQRTKLSQSEFATKFNIPVRTLQKWEQGAADPLPYFVEMLEEKIQNEEDFEVIKYIIKRSEHQCFKPVIKRRFKNIEKIHPLQQNNVDQLIQQIKEYAEVQRITVFGSSTQYRCNDESDLDVYVELKDDVNVKKYNISCPVDFWTNYTVTPEMLDEIKKTGVVVYDR